MYDEHKNLQTKIHSLSLSGRNKLSIDGVEDVSGFDETLVVLKTVQGDLNVRGRELHIERIDLDAGLLSMTGHIQELSYEETTKSGTLWQRLFG